MTQKDAVLVWHQNHLPPVRIFQHIVETYQMHKPRRVYVGDKWVQEIFQQVPAKASVWMTADKNWISYFPQGDDTIEPEIYCLRCTLEAMQWEFLGLGWNGVEVAMSRLEKRGSLVSESKKVGMPIDPRELRF